MSRLADALERVCAELDACGHGWAVIGGLALAVRAEPRQTRDIDIAIAVADDREAEALVRRLTQRGYRFLDEGVLEQAQRGRLATVRLQDPASAAEVPVPIDLFFSSSCVEEELVMAAERLEVLPGLTLPVATTGFLIALKVLAGRLQDLADVDNMLRSASSGDIESAKAAVALIERRGCNRGRDLAASLDQRLRGVSEP